MRSKPPAALRAQFLRESEHRARPSAHFRRANGRALPFAPESCGPVAFPERLRRSAATARAEWGVSKLPECLRPLSEEAGELSIARSPVAFAQRATGSSVSLEP